MLVVGALLVFWDQDVCLWCVRSVPTVALLHCVAMQMPWSDKAPLQCKITSLTFCLWVAHATLCSQLTRSIFSHMNHDEPCTSWLWTFWWMVCWCTGCLLVDWLLDSPRSLLAKIKEASWVPWRSPLVLIGINCRVTWSTNKTHKKNLFVKTCIFRFFEVRAPFV